MDHSAQGDPDMNGLRFGNRAAWDAMYARLWDVGMKVALQGLSGERHRLNRQDIVQNVILEIHRKFFLEDSGNQFRTVDDVTGMMYTVTRRRLLDFHRKQYRGKEDHYADPTLAGEPGDGGAPGTPSEADNLWDRVKEGMDDPETLWSLIGRLDPPKPELMEDRFVHNLSASDIESRRGIPRNTVLSHWRQAMMQLRKWLSDN